MIRLSNCFDGDFKTNSVCQNWCSQLIDFVRAEFDENPIVKIGAYNHGLFANITVDIQSRNNESRTLAITVIHTTDEIVLPEPDADQLDICLPGVVDTFYLISLITRAATVSVCA